MNREALKCVAPALFVLTFSATAQAELQPISEKEMGRVSGQAMVAVDVDGTDTNRFTRVTVGMDAEIQTNIDNVVLGDTGDGSDVKIAQLSLGHISTDQTKVQLDGQTYALNEIVPFVGSDPYFELAERDGEVVGFRMGLNQARGTLSGDITSFSGNLGIELQDASGNPVAAQLFDATGAATHTRATHIGLDDAATDCSAGVQCNALSNLKTLNIGTNNEDGTVGFAKELFVSFQKEAVQWQGNTEGGTPIDAAAGVFLNVPTAMRLDLQTLEQGVPRARTEYIDRGLGLF
ncbi:DUF6160 family protein [Marinobacter fonticola]|uniref:DUF6160 family protein n=1 Tax=Marinobacter fonticola TaxID=2603215 RepID=UPI0011E61E7F|nr:DUF6160 family protein [Marinobacter fonticola]